MLGEFGMPITIAYVASGFVIGTTGGAVLGKMSLESFLETDITGPSNVDDQTTHHTLRSRFEFGYKEAIDVIRQIWLWIFVGVAIGAFIHNYVPQKTIHDLMSATGIFSVPLATILGVPMYGSCAAIVPVAVVLFEKGIPIGTALSFMMAMAALSLPEAIMLRRTMRLPLIALYFGITASAIVITGYFLNWMANLFTWTN